MRLLQFAVPPKTTKSDVEEVLSSHPELLLKEYDSEKGSVIISTSRPVYEAEDAVKEINPKIKLIGQSTETVSDVAAVAIIGGPGGVRGIVRMIQEDARFSVEGTVEGLKSDVYSVTVNEFGDISDSCSSTGGILSKTAEGPPEGLLGDISGSGDAQTRFTLNSNNLSMYDCIGRSLVLQDKDKRVACGIIGRSPGLFENNKKICACDGTVIWEEQKFGPYAVAPSTS